MFRSLPTVCLALTLALGAQVSTAQTASPGCEAPTLDNGTYDILDGGIGRRFRVHMPRGGAADTPSALILAFHSWDGTENTLLDYRVIRRAANRMGAIIVAPAGLGTSENRPNSWTALGTATGIDGDGQAICDPAVLMDETYPSCGPVGTGTAQNICSWTQCQTNDLQFVDTLITHIEGTACIDSDRIFAAGVSNGGLFVWGMGQDPTLAPRLRGIASLVGLPHRGYLDGPGGDSTLPALLITGIEDPIVPPGDWEDPGFTTSTDGEDFYYTGATAIARAWSDGLACDTTIPATQVDVDNRRFDCRSYCSVAEGQSLPPVLDCRHAQGHDTLMRHSWPLIMQFFADQQGP